MATTELAGGLLVSDEALQLALRLEAAGYRLLIDGETLRLQTPAAGVKPTPDDVAAIRQYKPHLMAIVAYQAPPCTL